MSTNPDFDWDEVIVSKKPKQKEIDVSFSSDPDLTLGSIEIDPEDTIERPVSSTGLTECGQQKCSSAYDYQAALPYDEMALCYGPKEDSLNGTGVWTGVVDTPAAIRFRIANYDNFPSAQVLDNNYTYNINGGYDMVDFPSITVGAPCEAKYDNKALEATFLNAAPTSAVAFYPRAFEDAAGTVLGPGESLNVKTIMGQMIWGRAEDGTIDDSPYQNNRTGLGYCRLYAIGRDQNTGEFTGAGTVSINMAIQQTILTDFPNSIFAQVDLTSDSLNWNTTDNDGYPIQEQYSTRIDDSADYPYFSRGDQTGAYLCKMEMDIQMDQTGDSATARLYMESEHVLSGRRVTHEISHTTFANLNGGLKLSSPRELFPNGFYQLNAPISATETALHNTIGGMEATSRYFHRNDNIKRSMWLIAYDGWEKETVVRKACIEMERSRPDWQPADYCSRIL